MRRFALVFFGIAALLAGCASDIPVEIREPPPDNPRLPGAASGTQAVVGRTARWGGAIVAVENKENETWIELVAKDLGGYGRPLDTDRSEGRFIARVPGFLDPAIYSEGRQVTVYGRIEDDVERLIGEKHYVYPLVSAEKVYLWPEDRRDYYNYYDYNPYLYPFPYPPYPYGGYFYDDFFWPQPYPYWRRHWR